MSPPPRHSTWTMSYRERATLPNTAPLAAYLLRLMAVKRTNLCLSADVTSTSELLTLAEEVGDSICMFKVHANIVSDWGERCVRGLRSIAKRKRFLLFEDAKISDIGSTALKQYTGGPFRISRWAEIVNCHILPGPGIITALKLGAEQTLAHYEHTVHTEITASPRIDALGGDDSDNDDAVLSPDELSTPLSPRFPRTVSSDSSEYGNGAKATTAPDRKLSIVSISTTISMRTECISPLPAHDSDLDELHEHPDPLARFGEPPVARALLLIAEMSSKGNLFTEAYTDAALSMAREHRDFVIGFIGQRSLNNTPADNFIMFTPGCQLPPASVPTVGHNEPGSGKTITPKTPTAPGDSLDPRVQHTPGAGDRLGQQYNTPRKLIFEKGCDVVIVGRGIINSETRSLEAERYRREAWEAYEERIRG